MGEPLTLTLRALDTPGASSPSSPSGTGCTAASASTSVLLAAASKRPLTAEEVAKGLGPNLGDPTLVVPPGGLDVSGLELEAGELPRGWGVWLGRAVEGVPYTVPGEVSRPVCRLGTIEVPTK